MIKRYFSKLHIDLLNRIPKACLVLGAIYATLQFIGICLLCEKNDIRADENLNSENANLAVNIDDDENLTEPLITKLVTSDVNSLGVR